jgi:hypothetical protein
MKPRPGADENRQLGGVDTVKANKLPPEGEGRPSQKGP